MPTFDKAFDDVQFPEDEGRIGSRLGAADRLIVFDPPLAGPSFGQPVTQLAIRHHLLPRGLAVDAQAADVSALTGEPGFTFSTGAAQYRYSRLGVERLKVLVQGART